MKDNFKFAEELESISPLLDLILEYLNDKDLDNVKTVKKSWLEAAKRILMIRSKPCWVTCYQDNHNVFFKDSGNLHFNNSRAAIILFGKHFNLNDCISLQHETNTFQQVRFVEYFGKEIVSRRIRFCVLTCSKVFSSFSKGGENKRESMFDALLFPTIPGIKTNMFYCNFSKLKRDPCLLTRHIKTNEEVKCLLLFNEFDVPGTVHHFFKIILKDIEPNEIALGGGVIHGIKTFRNDEAITEELHSKSAALCITFTREQGTEPNFNAASYVLRGKELTDEELREKLLKFRNSIIMRKTSIALRVCCHAKSQKRRESVIFNELFPDTPLLGLEAAGEIGWNSFNIPYVEEPLAESKSRKYKKPYPKYRHEWSTVFVVITWGDIL